jgi:hypothetical protein
MKGWVNLLVVTKNTVTLPYPNTTILLQFRYQEYVSNYTGNKWVCDPDYLIDNSCKCNYRHFAANASSWTLGQVNANAENPYVLLPSAQWHIDYCSAQQTVLSGKCKMQHSLVPSFLSMVTGTREKISNRFFVPTASVLGAYNSVTTINIFKTSFVSLTAKIFCFKQSPALHGDRRQLAASGRLVFVIRTQYCVYAQVSADEFSCLSSHRRR